MDDARVYSERLGAIRDEQFAAAMTSLGLGTFVGAEPTTSGLFGQNVFVTTDSGEFVLRGAPHWVKGIDETEWRREDCWQFTKETFFARRLHEETKAPVAWPYLHVTSDDIFGWPFIVMPRMPGVCFEDRSILKALSEAERRAVAVALGVTLAEAQKLSSPFAGDFSPDTIALTRYPAGYVDWVVRESAAHARSVESTLTDDDWAWIDAAAAKARAAPDYGVSTFVHGDYKLNNLTVEKDAEGWRVSGLFDLHEARFGDGALDIVRQASSYLDTDPGMARPFVDSWRSRVPVSPSLKERLPLYVINDRMKLWSFFNRPGQQSSLFKGRSFREWTGRYLDAFLAVL